MTTGTVYAERLTREDPVQSRSHSARGNHVLSGHFVALVSALIALAAIRIAALTLNATELAVDEAQYWAWSRELAAGYFSKPPLIAWIIAGASATCGDSEFCIRLPAILMHLATSFVIYLLGVRLVSERAGFWAALTFATLPGIWLSSGLMTTDVPLLFAWALALLAFAELVVVPSWTMAVILGLALGLGLNAKYAMAYFILCAAIYFLAAPGRRALLRQPYLWLALAIAAMMIAPNAVWNLDNGFATLTHTADNARWSAASLNPLKGLEFLAAQFGVFGPILFAALLVIAIRLVKSAPGQLGSDRLLLAFSLPILVILTLQGVISRSHANWGAPAYIAATLLVVSVMIRNRDDRWMRTSLGVNVLIGAGITLALSIAPHVALPNGGTPFTQALGHRALADAVSEGITRTAERGTTFRTILSDDRDISAALTYYGRDRQLPPVMAWRGGERPRNHFELARPFHADAAGPVLLVSRRSDGSRIPQRFINVMELGAIDVPAGGNTSRTFHLFELSGFRGR